MRVFVIGASGFTGRHFLASAPANWQIGALVRSPEAAAVVQSVGAQPLEGDLDDQRTILTALQKWSPDVTICIASLGFGHAPAIVDSLLGAGANRAVFTSTTSIFTRLNPSSKGIRLAAEDTIIGSGLDYTILRPTMIYGAPGDRNMERLLSKLITIPLIPAPHRGRALQQPVHVNDLAEALIASVAEPQAVGHAFNVAGPDPLSFADIVRQAGGALNRPSRVLPVPTKLLRSIVAVQEKLLPRPRITTEQIDRLVEDKVFDITPARTVLGSDPRSFADGIAMEAEAVLGAGR